MAITFTIGTNTNGWTAQVELGSKDAYTLDGAWGATLTSSSGNSYTFTSYDNSLVTAGTSESLYFTVHTSGSDLCVGVNSFCYTVAP